MKKILFLSILAGLCLTGCTNDELVEGNDGQLSKSDYINFTFQQDNMTRADQKLSNTHYEFGVFADNGEAVMSNYLVGWGDASSPYKALLEGVTTYGDPTSQVDGLSYWFYETLSTTKGTTYTKAEQAQVLKFWDKSKANYYFWAYAPYTLKAGATAKNADKVTFEKGPDELLFTNLSSFYTSPVLKEDGTNKYQVTTADYAAAKVLGASDIAKYDAEMINYNEGLYAYSTKAKAAYGTDVPFTFKHINAKINLAFYEDIEGYSVEIMDMVPDAITAGSGNKYGIAQQNGIVLTPATPEQAVYYDQTTKEYKQQTAQDDLAKYLAEAQVDIKGVSATPTLVVGNASNTPKNDNLYFKPTTGSIATTNVGTTSATTLYVLPNYDGTNYITTDSAETTPSTIVENTGYTLHVSYKLIPEDGTAIAKMYDARVYIAPEYCQWQAGKAYKYIFKITLNANGTTDPANEDDKYTTEQVPTLEDKAYVDPTDPRVPDGGGLLPIVFDGIMVSDYEDVTVNPEFIITESDLETSFQKALKSITEKFSNGGAKPANITASGNGTSGSPFVVDYTVRVGDFTPGVGGVNDNNVFKDLQALSQAMYNQEGIKTIEYNSGVYTKSTDNSLNPPSWYHSDGAAALPGLSLEANIANVAYAAISEGEPLVPVAGKNTSVEFILKDGKTPTPNETYVKLNLTVVSD